MPIQKDSKPCCIPRFKSSPSSLNSAKIFKHSSLEKLPFFCAFISQSVLAGAIGFDSLLLSSHDFFASMTLSCMAKVSQHWRNSSNVKLGLAIKSITLLYNFKACNFLPVENLSIFFDIIDL